MGKTILKVEDITKYFPGVKALDEVNLELKEGEILGIAGENGAGKTTLMHILGGVYHPDKGRIYLDGKEIIFYTPYRAQQEGISIVFQELSLVPDLSIAENIFGHRQPVNRFRLIDQKKLYQKTEELLDLFELDIDPKTKIRYLSPARAQIVEILKAISQQTRILILDEPTTSLTHKEIKKLHENLKKLRSDGLSIIYISHKINEFFQIADAVSVLRDGHFVGRAEVTSVDENKIVSMMIGRELKNMYGKRDVARIGTEKFEVENYSKKGFFEQISFKVKEGEIFGIYGLVGAGRTELARAIFGVDQKDTGEVYLSGQKLEIRTPADAINAGLAYLTEERVRGLFFDMAIKECILAPVLKQYSNRYGFFNNQAIREMSNREIKRFKIKTPGINQKVLKLSGGNQQKVLLSLWVATYPRILILDEPTKGVDVGAKSDIYDSIRKLAREEITVILISSDLPEIIGLSDRVMVMYEGRKTGVLEYEDINEEEVMKYAVGFTNEVGSDIGYET